MSAIVMFLGLVIVGLSSTNNKKWYTKIGGAVGGLAIATLPVIIHLLSQK